MDAFQRINLRVLFALTISCWLTGTSRQCFGQHVYKDYVSDRYSQYSPFDHQQRGLIYRIQTGHAGIFGRCDDDRQKMISPYIDWHCRTPQRSLVLHFTGDLVTDMFRKSERIADGAGNCLIGRCRRCQQSGDDCNCQECEVDNGVAQRRPELKSPQVASSPKYRTEIYPNHNRYPPPNSALQHDDSPGPISNGRSSVAFSARNSSSRSSGVSRTDTSPDYHAANSTSANERSTRSWDGRNDLLTRNAYYSGIDQESSRKSSLQSAKPSHQQTSYQAESMPDSIDPRYSAESVLYPENKFEVVEKAVNNRKPQTRMNSTFQLSGGSVYSRPTVNRSQIKEQAPAQDRQSGPQYFQFQQIGGSKYR